MTAAWKYLTARNTPRTVRTALSRESDQEVKIQNRHKRFKNWQEGTSGFSNFKENFILNCRGKARELARRNAEVCGKHSRNWYLDRLCNGARPRAPPCLLLNIVILGAMSPNGKFEKFRMPSPSDSSSSRGATQRRHCNTDRNKSKN